MPHLFVIAKYPMTIPPAHHSNVYDSLAIVVKKITTMFPPPPAHLCRAFFALSCIFVCCGCHVHLCLCAGDGAIWA